MLVPNTEFFSKTLTHDERVPLSSKDLDLVDNVRFMIDTIHFYDSPARDINGQPREQHALSYML